MEVYMVEVAVAVAEYTSTGQILLLEMNLFRLLLSMVQ